MTDAAPSPVETRDPVVRDAAKQAAVWLGMAAAIWLAWRLSQPLLLILGGLVIAAGLDGGARLLGRLWDGPRWARVLIVSLLLAGAVAGFLAFAGTTVAVQFNDLARTLQVQIDRLSIWAQGIGFGPVGAQPAQSGGGQPNQLAALAGQLFGSVGDVTRFVGSAAGVFGDLLFMIVIGLFVAAEPRIYERGIAWLTPRRSRAGVEATLDDVGHMLRRWIGGRLGSMASDGVLVGVGLTIVGMPLSGLLGLISGLLAFIPNFGAIFAGGLIALVALSQGTQMLLAAMIAYVVVETIQGNFITTMFDRRSVDIAPAVTLGAQLLFGSLFGLLGLALANPIVAALKVALDRPATR